MLNIIATMGAFLIFFLTTTWCVCKLKTYLEMTEQNPIKKKLIPIL